MACEAMLLRYRPGSGDRIDSNETQAVFMNRRPWGPRVVARGKSMRAGGHRSRLGTPAGAYSIGTAQWQRDIGRERDSRDRRR